MDINYELYKVFFFVADTLSFSEASRRLYISQSAVSQSIKTLEKKLGQPLFQRSTKRVQLTPAGQTLLKHIEPAMRLIERGESQLLEGSSLGLEQLHIGASDTICRYILVPYLQRFHEIYPDVPIKVTNATSIRCVELLEQQKVDLIFTNLPNPALKEDYRCREILRFTDVFIASPAHFPPMEGKMTLQELTTLPLMMLDRRSATSDFLRQFFLSRQLELLPEIELSSNDLLIDLARIGLGIAFVPDYCLRENSEGLYALQLQEQLPMRRVAAVVNPAAPVTRTTEAFLQLFD